MIQLSCISCRFPTFPVSLLAGRVKATLDLKSGVGELTLLPRKINFPGTDSSGEVLYQSGLDIRKILPPSACVSSVASPMHLV